jgi:hypothetical protein
VATLTKGADLKGDVVVDIRVDDLIGLFNRQAYFYLPISLFALETPCCLPG